VVTAIEPYTTSCRPPVWARGGHAQTILAHLIPVAPVGLGPGASGVERHEVPLSDGDRLCVFYRAGTSGVLVPIFHGLSGDSDADYVRLAVEAAQRAGHSVLAVNHRGCGAGRGLARGLYHSGRSDDVGAVLAWARTHLPEERMLAVGFSLSGNALLLLLSETEEAHPDGAIAINPPIDLRHCSERISSGLNCLYDRRFVRRCMGLVRERVADGLLEAEYARLRPRSLWDFDELVTAPLGGFVDAEDYYRRCSTRDRLKSIEVPTVVITSEDDPFVSAEILRRAPLSCSTHLHIERHGGHVGYLTQGASGLGAQRWLEGSLGHYLALL
jgi:predicted alpha/beta-fold hydrolase